MTGWRLSAALLAAVVLSDWSAWFCARGWAQERDPIQSVNRKIFWFNDRVDVYFLEPVAKGWHRVMPDRVETAITHFFANLGVPAVAVNNLLQAKPIAAASDVGRFAVNSTVGLAGFFDPASGWGLEAHDEDVGQTFGRWGIPPGPYVVLPFLGPSNPRDAVGLIGDYALTVYPFFINQFITLGAGSVNVVNKRSAYLDEVRNAKEASVDYYVFIRNAYIQRREALVSDSKEMSAEQEEDLYYFDEGDSE